MEAKFNPTSANFEDNSIKTLKSVIFVIYIIPCYFYEVILYYKVQKDKKKGEKCK